MYITCTKKLTDTLRREFFLLKSQKVEEKYGFVEETILKPIDFISVLRLFDAFKVIVIKVILTNNTTYIRNRNCF